MLDYLLALLPDDLEQTLQEFRKVFDPVAAVLSGALGRLATLGDGLAPRVERPRAAGRPQGPAQVPRLATRPTCWRSRG
jgi:hypothetical protein